MSSVRTPAVAGLFYPADPRQLAHDVQQLLAAAQPHGLTPKALIVPHAGYIYSGPIAATAYATLKPIASHIRRVVLLGPPIASRCADWRCPVWMPSTRRWGG